MANKAARVLWGLSWLVLCRFTPPPLWSWRSTVLRLFGASVGANVRIYGSTRIWLPRNLAIGEGAVLGRCVNCYNQGHITIGPGAVISQNVSLIASTHLVEDPSFPLVLRPVHIGRAAWVAAEAFVGPGVTIGEGAVLGARGVAMQDLAPWTYYAGNPATRLKPRPNPDLR
ncbi:MAG: putative colanic acid biosynthesis acetyltransferase [Croceibacterium sp.]